MKKNSLMFVKTLLTYAHRELKDLVAKDNVSYITDCIDNLLMGKADDIEIIADELKNTYEFNKDNNNLKEASETMIKLVLEKNRCK